MLNILGSLNEFEVNVLGERIRDVKQFKKSNTQNLAFSNLIWRHKNDTHATKYHLHE